jgi:hypothetical protein
VLRLQIGNGIFTSYRSHDLIASDKEAPSLTYQDPQTRQ